MSGAAQYADKPKVGIAGISVANTNRDGTGTLATAFVAGPNGARVDRIDVQATATTTAGMVRAYIGQGRPGLTINTITFSTTTATVTTASNHGLTTGDLVTVQSAFPDNYNVTDVAVTVLTSNTFSYSMAVAPTLNASTVGYYSTTPSAAVSRLWFEVPVSAVTPSGTVAAFTSAKSSALFSDQGWLPLVLQPGWRVRFSTHNAEAFNCIVNGGDL